MSRNVLIWDFDGTLAYRAGMWSGALIDVLDCLEPGHRISVDHVRPFLGSGFPWHKPDNPHPELCNPEVWWKHLEPIFAKAYVGVGVDHSRAAGLARHVRARFLDVSNWFLYPEVCDCLDELSGDGWRHVILSNHVPELEEIVTALGLRDQVEAVHTSALLGYEKPNSHAYRRVLESVGGVDRVWMIGDNPVADFAGAGGVGIPGILVRNDEGAVSPSCADLTGVRGFVSA